MLPPVNLLGHCCNIQIRSDENSGWNGNSGDRRRGMSVSHVPWDLGGQLMTGNG